MTGSSKTPVSSFVLTQEGVLAAQRSLLSEPATLTRALQYAVQHLQNDLREHPEDAEATQAELDQLVQYRLRFLAALRGQEVEQLTVDEAWATMTWLLGTELDAEQL